MPVSIISYNVLCPQRCENLQCNLDTISRKTSILLRIDAWMAAEKIICLQDVCTEWMDSLFTLMLKNGYTHVARKYLNTYIVIAWPLKVFQPLRCITTNVAESIECKPMSFFCRIVKFLFREEVCYDNIMLCVQLRVLNTKATFCIANFFSEGNDLYSAICTANHVADTIEDRIVLVASIGEEPQLINTDTLVDASADYNFTRWTELYKGRVDCIFHSPDKFIKITPTGRNMEEGPFLTAQEPSDHIPVMMTFH